MFYHIERDEKKIVLQYLMLSQSVFHWQFLFTYIFFASLKFGACYITGKWGKFRVQNVTFFCCFSSKNLCFYHFHFFFWWSIKFPQQNINQSETGTGDELYGTVCITSKYNPHFDDYIKCKRPSQMMMF